MRALVEKCSDDCTYSYENVFFVLQDEMITDIKFQNKLKEMFPTITEDQIIMLVVDNEEIEVYNDSGDKFVISLSYVDYFA